MIEESEAGVMSLQPRMVGNHEELEEAGRILRNRVQREHGPANTLIVDFELSDP